MIRDLTFFNRYDYDGPTHQLMQSVENTLGTLYFQKYA